MSTINLSDAKVSYEGQNLPAINLLSKLQVQLQEAACRMAAIASTLGDLQAALLNSNTVDVRLTLSKEDFGRFRSLSGIDDSERIRKAVMALIHPGEAEGTSGSVNSQPGNNKAGEVSPTHETVNVPVEPILQEQPPAEEPPVKRKTTKCPRCQSSIDLPEVSNEQWSVEIKCESCGTKYLMKSPTVSAG